MTFSVITVTFNAERWIERTMDSIMSQTFNDFEYIIIDGASTDSTIDIVRKKTEKYCKSLKYKIISEPDDGIYDAMNKGLLLAEGNYVWFLNAGDTFYSEDTLQNVYNEINKYKSTDLPIIVYGETEITDAKGVSKGMRHLRAPEHLDWKSFKMGMLVCHQSFVVRRDIAVNFNLHYRLASDIDWCIRCMKKRGQILNSHLVLSRFLEAGVSDKKRKSALKERYNIMCHYYGTLPTFFRHLWFALRFSISLFKK